MPVMSRFRLSAKQRPFREMGTLLSGLLVILVADHATASENQPGYANRILCLRPNASLDPPNRKAVDAAVLACLLSASSPGKTVTWQREFRRCLSDHAVTLVVDCQY
jgi:hypothetical protein